MGAPKDATYVPNARFILEIDNISIMSFEKVGMGDSEWGIIEGRTGADDLIKNTSSGLKTVTTFTIEKHLRDSGGSEDIKELINWHAAGSNDRRTGAIIIQDREGAELLRYEFKYAWISKHTPPELDASQDNSPLVFIFELSVGEFKAA